MKDLRRHIIKGILVSLGAAAVAGILGVLISNDVIMLVMYSAATTAVAALLLMPLAGMVDRPQMRSAGLLGVILVIVEYLLSVAMIWDLQRALSGRGRNDEELIMTAFLIVGCGIPAMMALRGLHRDSTYRAARVGLALTTAVFTIAQAAIMIPGSEWRLRESLGQTSMTLAGFGLIIVAALVGFKKGDRRYWRWVCVLNHD